MNSSTSPVLGDTNTTVGRPKSSTGFSSGSLIYHLLSSSRYPAIVKEERCHPFVTKVIQGDLSLTNDSFASTTQQVHKIQTKQELADPGRAYHDSCVHRTVDDNTFQDALRQVLAKGRTNSFDPSLGSARKNVPPASRRVLLTTTALESAAP